MIIVSALPISIAVLKETINCNISWSKSSEQFCSGSTDHAVWNIKSLFYPGGAWFEYCLGFQLLWLRFSVIFLSLSKQVSGFYRETDQESFFQHSFQLILHRNISIWHNIIRYILEIQCRINLPDKYVIICCVRRRTGSCNKCYLFYNEILLLYLSVTTVIISVRKRNSYWEMGENLPVRYRVRSVSLACGVMKVSTNCPFYVANRWPTFQIKSVFNLLIPMTIIGQSVRRAPYHLLDSACN